VSGIAGHSIASVTTCESYNADPLVSRGKVLLPAKHHLAAISQD
jgi:hypothetical protein